MSGEPAGAGIAKRKIPIICDIFFGRRQKNRPGTRPMHVILGCEASRLFDGSMAGDPVVERELPLRSVRQLLANS